LIVLINKIDLSTQSDVEQKIREMMMMFPRADIIPISALHKFNLESVFDRIISLLPESPAYYPKDELTDRSERFFVSEIIREKILMNYHQEIPYTAEVVIDSFKEKKDLTVLSATIFVGRESQKAIIIGHEGKALKKLGTEARKDIEAFLECKVYLELNIKIRKDWRDDPQELKRFGYEL
jgi:GTP-binding protein Era